MKTCFKCRKPGEFGVDKSKKDGASIYCKPCATQRYLDYRIRREESRYKTK